MLNRSLGEDTRQIGVFGLSGDSVAVTTHNHHKSNPAINTASVCVLDGDSSVTENLDTGIFKLAGGQPENYLFSFAADQLTESAALLSAYCQYDPTRQSDFKKAVERVRTSTEDPHLYFSKLGIELGFISEEVVKRAFVTYWCDKSKGEVDRLGAFAREHLKA